VAQNRADPKSTTAAYASPPCYAHEFPGWFGEDPEPAPPGPACDGSAQPAASAAAEDPAGKPPACPQPCPETR